MSDIEPTTELEFKLILFIEAIKIALASSNQPYLEDMFTDPEITKFAESLNSGKWYDK